MRPPPPLPRPRSVSARGAQRPRASGRGQIRLVLHRPPISIVPCRGNAARICTMAQLLLNAGLRDVMSVTKRGTRTAALEELQHEAATCTACDLYKRATQTVFGEGNPSARIILVGEQPGHEEDLAGHPFVGPAGRLLDEALDQAGLDRTSLYVTNAVKHFKWKSQGEGKRRIHDKPNQTEIGACKPWFQQEIELIGPTLVVCLGATAATS